MSSRSDRPRFIPFRRIDLLQMCLDEDRLEGNRRTGFLAVAQALMSVLHLEFHDRLEALKEAYAPFNPDPDTRRIHRLDQAERLDRQRRLVSELKQLLIDANYREIGIADLHAAFVKEALVSLRLDMDLDDFEELAIYRRGIQERTGEVERTWWFGTRQVTFKNLSRVVLLIKFKDNAYFESKGRKNLAFEPGSTILKMFQNVPQGDLEMLFPNTTVKMRTLDKLIIGVPALAGSIAVFSSKLIASLGLLLLLGAFYLGLRDQPVQQLSQGEWLALFASLGAAGAFLYRQYSKFKNRKIMFMKRLMEHLYFRNLDNDAGVFHNLLDAAEEEEFKEALLAYWFLLSSDQALSAAEIDQGIEKWLSSKHDCEADFEIADALGKLTRWELVTRRGDRYQAVEPEPAIEILRSWWDGYLTSTETRAGT